MIIQWDETLECMVRIKEELEKARPENLVDVEWDVASGYLKINFGFLDENAPHIWSYDASPSPLHIGDYLVIDSGTCATLSTSALEESLELKPPKPKYEDRGIAELDRLNATVGSWFSGAEKGGAK